MKEKPTYICGLRDQAELLSVFEFMVLFGNYNMQIVSPCEFGSYSLQLLVIFCFWKIKLVVQLSLNPNISL